MATNKKVKLPRKRKKAYMKAHSRADYMGLQILGEILAEEGRKNGDRFYTVKGGYKPTKQNPNGYKPIKRW